MASNEKGFDYSALNQETAKVVQACTKEIQSRMVKTVEQMIAIGSQLQIAKQELKYGQFQSWLLDELNIHPRQARRLMLVAKQFSADIMSAVEITPTALYLLAEPQTPNEARQEAINRAEVGEKITLPIAKEIVARYKADTEQPPTATTSALVSASQAKAKKMAEVIETSTHQEHKETMTLLDTTNQPYKNATEQRAEHAIIDVPAVTISDEPIAKSVPQLFKVGDRIRIIRRQHGADDWTGSTATIWEVTTDGWLRVNVEGKDGVKFTLHPDWVELLEAQDMNETQDQSFSKQPTPTSDQDQPSDSNRPKVTRLEYNPPDDLDILETFVINSPSFMAEVKCTPSQMIAILEQLGINP